MCYILQEVCKMEDNKVTRSIRADAETIDRFKILAEQFNNQGECLESLIRTYEMDNAKKINSEMKMDIRSYESHSNALNNLYLSSIEKNNELVRKNTKLADKIKELMQRIETYESATNNIKNGVDDKENENEEDSVRFKNIGELCARNRDLAEKLEGCQKENDQLIEKMNKVTKENADLSIKISELQIKAKQNELNHMKAMNEQESRYLKKMSELMETKDKLANELYELKNKQ